MSDERVPFNHERDLLCWQGSSGQWLVAHPWLDVITQAPTREQAMRSFLETFALLALHQIGRDGRLVMRLTPPEKAERWRRLAEAGSEEAAARPLRAASDDLDDPVVSS